MTRLGITGRARDVRATILGRISTTPAATDDRPDTILMTDQDLSTAGYAGLLTTRTVPDVALGCPTVDQVPSLAHLEDGDVVALNTRGYVRTLYRRASPHNSIFTTDRCNSYCLMCSQPPKEVDDRERITEHLRLLDLVDPETRELGITGGEPTLLGDDLFRIIRKAKERLPSTALHVLSNGRRFFYGSYARRLAAIEHPDLMIGIPLYAATDTEHDHVVQARGAFDETMIGLHNLGNFEVPVEIRVVLHARTVPRLAQLADFIYRNVPFAAQVVFMGLEPTGFAVPNLGELWIDPWEYRHVLTEAILSLADRGMTVAIYNHQLCTLPEEIWPYARQSISDWKNEFLPVCDPCAVKDSCAGFFASAPGRRTSTHITPIDTRDPRDANWNPSLRPLRLRS